jgi:hypothetical protein
MLAAILRTLADILREATAARTEQTATVAGGIVIQIKGDGNEIRLEQATAERSKLAYTWPDELPFRGYMEEKREAFAGRDWLFIEIDQWLISGVRRALLITADYGVGKSAIIAEYVHRHLGGTAIAWH